MKQTFSSGDLCLTKRPCAVPSQSVVLRSRVEPSEVAAWIKRFTGIQAAIESKAWWSVTPLIMWVSPEVGPGFCLPFVSEDSIERIGSGLKGMEPIE